MNFLITLFLSFIIPVLSYATGPIHEFKLKDYKGNIINLDVYKGKTLLIVNIATKCGYTPQLDDLEKLYSKYKEKDFMILGIPSNDFKGQSPESNEGIAKFCHLKYGVQFPIIEKMKVLGEHKAEFFKFLQVLKQNKEIDWNFEKFLFDKNGNFVSHYSSKDLPLNGNLENRIKNLIK